MRIKTVNNGLTVQAIAGTYVVLLGLDMAEAECNGLLGFAIHRTDHTEEEAYWLEGTKTFQDTDPGFQPGSKYSTRQHPIQGFSWSDFSAKPGYDYTYRVVALTGAPENLQPFKEASVRVQTECPEGGDHDIYFNRGAAASQEYARRFGNRRPDKVGEPAFQWLSRGLCEAMVAFIRQAKDAHYGLRVCAYEFHYPKILQELKAAHDRGAKVEIIYDCRKKSPGVKNQGAVDAAGLALLCTKRTANRSAISHNKFIVLVEDGRPRAVLTGGTNFSESGIFGHSNAAHVVEDPQVAQVYSSYWDLLAQDPKTSVLAPKLCGNLVLPQGLPAPGTTGVFSPRKGLEALQWYVRLASQAQKGLFMTLAFGMHDDFQAVYANSTAKMRYALMEKATRPMEKGPERDAEEAKIRALRRLPENRFAIGAHFEMNKFDRWLGERLSGLSRNVRYVHTKYMLVDPLGPDPIVVAGSANFSEASCNENDENMLVIRGNKRVAEIYLGEFMRLYNHYAFREWAAKQPSGSAAPAHLRTDDWWRAYFGQTDKSHQRQYFAG